MHAAYDNESDHVTCIGAAIPALKKVRMRDAIP